MGIILAYDITDDESFSNIRNWMRQIDMHAAEGVAKLIIGTKCDSPDRVISVEQGRRLAAEYGVQFLETSAKENLNVDETFYTIAKEITGKQMT
jgi:Ras-related protein Rab-8A